MFLNKGVVVQYIPIVLSAFIFISCAGHSHLQQKSNKVKEYTDKVTTKKSAPKRDNFRGSYQIKPGDTYMWISHKLYGDYRKWRDLAYLNPTHSANNLKVGDHVTYERHSEIYHWQRPGVAYQIKSGDTLGVIAKDFYASSSYWSAIRENNRDLIRDPDLIFAGHILFYQPIEKDELAIRDAYITRKTITKR